jgi:hypothetical protein
MSMSQEEIEALMGGVDFEEESSEEENVDNNIEDDNYDDILAGIDGISDDVEEDSRAGGEEDNNSEEGLSPPYPVQNEHQIVNQLNEVADDSEEKASQIFDVLTFILDENDKLKKSNTEMTSFVKKQIELLESLNTKFPKINIFSENLDESNTLLESLDEAAKIIDNENNKIFDAMELMQYHDINRQKIERVMSVIKSLTRYLNSIFIDDSGKAEVQIAKHISGDSSDSLGNEDLDALITEFGKEV